MGMVLLLSVLIISPRGWAITTNELRTAWIYTFAKHTIWPNDEQLEEIVIGFYPAQPKLEALLRSATEDKPLRSKRIRVTSYRDLKAARQAHLLVLGGGKNTQLQAVSVGLSGSSTLLVTEAADDSLHTMINLLPQGDRRFTFEVHRPNIVYEGLDVGQDLLLSGGSELDIARIYKESERALVQVKDSLKLQAEALQQQELALVKKTQQVQERAQQQQTLEANIEQLHRQLKEDRQHLDQNKHQLQQDKQRAQLNQLSLNKQQLTLQQQQSQVKKMTLELNVKLGDISKNNRLLAEQEAVIDGQKQRISQQRETLEAKTETIEQQQGLLFYQKLVLVSLGLIVLITLYSIYARVRASKKMARTNQQLAVSNTQLEKTTADLRHAVEAKSMFLSTMSHEIRTPLNGVLGMAELLASSKLDSEQQRNLGIIQSSGKLLVNVINDILDYSKIEAGKMELEHIDFQPSHLLQECAATFNRTAQEQCLEFSLLIDPDVPEVLEGDPSRITQVLTNFLSNAFKFTEAGEVVISVSLLAEPQVWRFSVRDSGPGMSAQQCEAIFSPFTQADASITRSHGGTGLGLSICKRLVELMGGDVGVDSRLGQGSVFWAQLPVTDAALSQASRRHLPEALSVEPMLVMIEHPGQRDNLCAHLRHWGITPQPLASAEALWQRLAQVLGDDPKRRPTILLSDKVIDLSKPHPVNLMDEAYLVYLCSRAQSMALEEQPGCARLRQPVNAAMIFDALVGLHRPASMSQPAAEQQLSQYPHARVLVAEDNAVNQMVVKGLLKQYGIAPTLVENGQLALEALQKMRFDLVLMDCEMPVLDGYDATRLFRDGVQCAAAEKTAIVALTAHAMTEHRDRAQAAGMDDHLAKPIARAALESVLARFCPATD